MNSKLFAATVVVAFATGATQVHSAPPSSDSAPLPTALAIKAAEAALAACVNQGLTPTITIADRTGVIHVVLVGDGAGPVGISTSRRKAYTAAALGVSSGEFKQQVAQMHLVPQTVDPELLEQPGGLPIKRHGVTIAGIGVGGADKDGKSVDEQCAQAGIDAIKSELEQ